MTDEGKPPTRRFRMTGVLRDPGEPGAERTSSAPDAASEAAISAGSPPAGGPSPREDILRAVERAFVDAARARVRSAFGGPEPGQRVVIVEEIEDLDAGEQEGNAGWGLAKRAGGPEATPPPPAPEEIPEPLLSPDPEVRRRALAAVLAGASDPPIEALTRGLRDPDPDIRRMAARTLGRVRARVPVHVVERALRDPDEQVREAMIAEAASRGPSAVALLAPLIVERRWPRTQQAALEALPALFEGPAGMVADLEALLWSASSLQPRPAGPEQRGFAAVARAIGVERLLDELARPDLRRLGAARLLAEAGSDQALRALAALTDDPLEEVRAMADQAADRMGGPSPGGTVSRRTAPEESDGVRIDTFPTKEVLAALAKALLDPDELVRAAAGDALQLVSEGDMEAWAGAALHGEDEATAVLAAAALEQRPIARMAGPLLRRAASQPFPDRGPYLSALSALRPDPAELGRIVATADRDDRASAVRLVGELADRVDVPWDALRPLLADPSASVRMAVLEGMEGRGGDSAADVAMEALGADTSAMVRATAIRLLARAGRARRREALIMALGDPDPDVRATAIELLPTGMATELAEPLLQAFQDGDERVWRSALPHLAALTQREESVLWAAMREASSAKREELSDAVQARSPARLPELVDRYARAPDPEDRALAVQIAGRAGTAECADVVRKALADPDPVVRRAAASAMSQVRSAEAVEALARAMGDPRVEVRREAIGALSAIDDDEVLPVLIAALKDPEVRIRRAATDALARWRSPGVARRLAAELPSADLRRPVADLLEQMGDSAVDALVEVVTEGDQDAAVAAAGVLHRMVGTDRFVSMLGDVDPEQRFRAVEVLGAIGGSAACEALLTCLADPDDRVRARAVSVLGALEDPRAVEPLKRVFRSDPVLAVAMAARSSLRLLAVEEADVAEQTKAPRVSEQGPGGGTASEPEPS